MSRHLQATDGNHPPEKTTKAGLDISVDRRTFLAGIAGTAVVAACHPVTTFAQTAAPDLNLARVAIPSSLTTTSENKIGTLNDGFTPANSRDRQNGSYAIRRGSRG